MKYLIAFLIAFGCAFGTVSAQGKGKGTKRVTVKTVSSSGTPKTTTVKVPKK